MFGLLRTFCSVRDVVCHRQATFFKMRSLFFENDLDSSKHLNILYGLGTGANFSAGKGGGGADRPPGVWEEGNPNP